MAKSLRASQPADTDSVHSLVEKKTTDYMTLTGDLTPICTSPLYRKRRPQFKRKWGQCRLGWRSLRVFLSYSLQVVKGTCHD